MFNKVKITGLWKDKDKKGNTILKGKVGNFYVQINPNGFKEKDSEPDYILYFTQVSNDNTNNKDEL